ncbi:MAG: tRNA glutamyl-Q(34) synthetase GluQRS [Mariprofundaceae bacterium]
MQLRTRFAPSPTGLLHIGNAYSVLVCQQWAKTHAADLLLRIEDIDYTRCRPEYAEAILSDLDWLGLKWDTPVHYQSQGLARYREAIDVLRRLGVIYPCFCTRRHIQEEIKRMGAAPHAEDETLHYPGICRVLPVSEREQRMRHELFAWRLDAARALEAIGKPLSWRDEHGKRHPVHLHGDLVIGRKDIQFSYHLAVVVDDAKQGITHVIRGRDLQASTAIHRILQHLLGLPEPVYIHHALLQDTHGQRLAKRNQATTLQSLRTMGICPDKLKDFLLHTDAHTWPFPEHDMETIKNQLGTTQNTR